MPRPYGGIGGWFEIRAVGGRLKPSATAGMEERAGAGLDILTGVEALGYVEITPETSRRRCTSVEQADD